MKRLLILAALLIGVPSAEAQVSVRAPFVRVQVGGGGVSVRAPFVGLYIPPGPPVYIGQPPVAQFAPAPGYVAAPPIYAAPAPPPQAIPKQLPPLAQAAPAPQAVPVQPQADFLPPVPAKVAVPTLAEFAKNFQPRPGNYEVSLINPLTGQPTPVRFALHANPQNVRLGDNLIEFQFGPNQFVRIEFDRQGAFVVSR